MLNALSPNLAPSLDLLLGRRAQSRPFAPDEIERLRAQTLTGIAQLQKDPTRVARRLLPVVHVRRRTIPMAARRAAIRRRSRKFSRDDLVAFQQRWLRPDNVKIYVVSDRPLAEVQPLLEARFGKWTAPAVAKGVKTFTAPPPRPAAPEDPARQPARRAAVEHPRRAAAADRSAGRHHAVRHRQRRARRRIPVAAQHGPARGQGLVVRRERQRRA